MLLLAHDLLCQVQQSEVLVSRQLSSLYELRVSIYIYIDCTRVYYVKKSLVSLAWELVRLGRSATDARYINFPSPSSSFLLFDLLQPLCIWHVLFRRVFCLALWSVCGDELPVGDGLLVRYGFVSELVVQLQQEVMQAVNFAEWYGCSLQVARYAGVQLVYLYFDYAVLSEYGVLHRQYALQLVKITYLPIHQPLSPASLLLIQIKKELIQYKIIRQQKVLEFIFFDKKSLLILQY